MPDTSIELLNLSKSFKNHKILSCINFEFKKGLTHILLGGSGVGKSTILKLIAGILQPDSGDVLIFGKSTQMLSAAERCRTIGFVFDNGALFPHLTARKNVSIANHAKVLSKAELEEKISELEMMFNLTSELLDHYPYQLSAGQVQRIALMRALILDPPVLLMDEPMSALDPILRADLQMEFHQIFKKLQKTVIYVSHDLAEASRLGDQVHIMALGKIIQSGTLQDLFNQPKTPYVSKFIEAQWNTF